VNADGWGRLRYGQLLAIAARDRRLGAAYAAFVARVEERRDPDRRAIACARIARWLRCTPVDAAGVFRASLRSEASEDADSAFFMRHTDALPAAFAGSVPLAPEAAPILYVGLHLGSPVLGYLALCRRIAPDLALIARGIDPAKAIELVREARGPRAIETREQEDFVRSFTRSAR